MIEHQTMRLQLPLQPILGERVFDHDVNPFPIYIQCSAIQRDQQARQGLIFDATFAVFEAGLIA
jgi:hypothetical protein